MNIVECAEILDDYIKREMPVFNKGDKLQITAEFIEAVLDEYVKYTRRTGAKYVSGASEKTTRWSNPHITAVGKAVNVYPSVEGRDKVWAIIGSLATLAGKNPVCREVWAPAPERSGAPADEPRRADPPPAPVAAGLSMNTLLLLGAGGAALFLLLNRGKK